MNQMAPIELLVLLGLGSRSFLATSGPLGQWTTRNFPCQLNGQSAPEHLNCVVRIFTTPVFLHCLEILLLTKEIHLLSMDHTNTVKEACPSFPSRPFILYPRMDNLCSNSLIPEGDHTRKMSYITYMGAVLSIPFWHVSIAYFAMSVYIYIYFKKDFIGATTQEA